MQMTEIAKALSENAKILILDEPTSALTEAEIDKLMEILQTLKEHGVTCIYITHKLEEFFRITDTITVLRDGKVDDHPADQGSDLEKLVSYMVGREMKERFPKGNRKPGRSDLRSRRSACAGSRRRRTAKCSRASSLTCARARSWASPA